jgi:uncharacterized protein YegP (UPF0339 family)
MRQTIVCLFLLAGLTGFCLVSERAVVAQGAKEAKAPYIEVSEGKDSKFRFTVRSGEGKLLAMSGPTGYATEKDALKAVEDLKTAMTKAKVMPTKKKK